LDPLPETADRGLLPDDPVSEQLYQRGGAEWRPAGGAGADNTRLFQMIVMRDFDDIWWTLDRTRRQQDVFSTLRAR
jgi:hypothetical protein